MKQNVIKDILFLKVYNSRGEETIKISVLTDRGWFGSCAPHGASSGEYEAKNIDVGKAEKVFNKIKNDFIGVEPDFSLIDEMLEQFGGENFSEIGGNLSIAISQAVCKAASQNRFYGFIGEANAFPFPLGNVVGGGAHGGNTDMQEFLVIPRKAKTIPEAAETNFAIWRRVSEVLKGKGLLVGRNDEGAFISKLNDIETLNLLSTVAKDFGARVGIDFAASQLFSKGCYSYGRLGKVLFPEQQMDFVTKLIKDYKLAYVEDPFEQNDFENFGALAKKAHCIVCGDDLFASHPERLKEGIGKKAGNAVILKPNQAGTVSKFLETAKIAIDNKFMPVVSHRSGDTCDPFISDLAVGIGAPLIKCGIMGSERASKVNRLAEIWSRTLKPKMARLKI